MDFWQAVVLIVFVVVAGRVMSGGRWNSKTRRWENYSPDNPYVKQGAVDGVPELKREIERLNQRVATLEKLATDPGRRLADEIESLRKIPPAA